MTAKEAYDLATSKYQELMENQFENIMIFIEDLAKNGKFSYECSELIYPEVTDKLKALGYQITQYGSNVTYAANYDPNNLTVRAKLITKISWYEQKEEEEDGGQGQNPEG